MGLIFSQQPDLIFPLQLPSEINFGNLLRTLGSITQNFKFVFVCTQDWDRQNPTQIVTEMCGFVTILSGTFLLHKTKDMADGKFIYRFL